MIQTGLRRLLGRCLCRQILGILMGIVVWWVMAASAPMPGLKLVDLRARFYPYQDLHHGWMITVDTAQVALR